MKTTRDFEEQDCGSAHIFSVSGVNRLWSIQCSGKVNQMGGPSLDLPGLETGLIPTRNHALSLALILLATCFLQACDGQSGRERGVEDPPGAQTDQVEPEAPSSRQAAERVEDTAPASVQQVSYQVDATATSSSAESGGEPETFSTSYALDVRRTDTDGFFSLDMSIRLRSRPEAWAWIEDGMPGTWHRTYRSDGKFLNGRTDRYASIFNNMTHGLYSVSHLVLRLPSMKLEPGSTWQTTEQQPTGRVRFAFEVIDLTDSTISIKSSATLTPFTDQDDFSWEETVEGKYDRSSLLANSLRIERRRHLNASLTRQGSAWPVSLSETTELRLSRTGS